MPKTPPEEYTFLHILRGRTLRGWRPREVYSLGINDCSLVTLPPDADPDVVEARSFFYPGFHEQHYPHIICEAREPLVLILIGLYGAKGHTRPGEAERKEDKEDAHMKRIHDLVRPTWGWVNNKRTHVIPAPGDSRYIWEGRNHRIRNKERIPKSVRLLDEKTFNRLRRDCPTCFLQSLKAPS